MEIAEPNPISYFRYTFASGTHSVSDSLTHFHLSLVLMIKFSDLPYDILSAIYAYITPQDLLALNQTCRALYALGISDYVWHRLEIDLPLEFDQKTNTGEYRPFYEIRRNLLNSLRVEANWGNKSTQIRKLMRIDHGGLLSRVQLLRNDWLITLSRNQTTNVSYLSAWHLDGGGCAHCAAKVEVMGDPNKFAAAVQDNSDSALVTLFNNSRIARRIQVFSLSLTDNYLHEDALISPLQRVLEISLADKLNSDHDPPEYQGMFIEAQVNNNIVATSLARVNRSGPPLTYQIILVNMDTYTALVLKQDLAEDVASSRFTFKLFPEHIAILFAKMGEGSLIWKDVKDLTKSGSSLHRASLQGVGPTTLFMNQFPVLNIGSLQSQYTSEYFSMSHDVSFTAESLRPTQSGFGIVSCRLEKLWFFYFTLEPTVTAPSGSISVNLSSISLKSVTSFSLKSDSHVENLALGRTGCRIVWLERSWETDEYRLLKATLPGPRLRNKVLACNLIPPHIALPFELHKCSAIWFEEATGRICFGLHTGEVYILEL
ncbi:hypothetical protein P691DRAFT_150705 [Macrolepiota fuliginosa MF-IS2]|uniref:F-box domain-containing protein n=1 Tax=Macrolepiota fuliginosa MF-IS2 TaxID=1400762 RepID=A0A9P6C8F8_9AGAR|nr:hypothetical protein P691DRAFT_150705 [Macrolepiota fuliginosa MF-IS2]